MIVTTVLQWALRFLQDLRLAKSLLERVYMTQPSTNISILNKYLLQLALGIRRPFWTLSSNRSHNMESIIKKKTRLSLYIKYRYLCVT